MGRFSYSSGADELVRGYQLGTSISDRAKKNKMDEEVAASLARKQEAGADYTRSMGLTGADEQARMLQEQSGGFGAEGAQATAGALNANTKDASKADAGLYGKYTLGDQVQDTEFTPEQVRGLNRQAAKDALGKYGEEGARRIAQMNSEDVADMQMRGLKRADAASMKELEDTTVLGSMRSKMAAAKPEEQEKLSAEYEQEALKRLGAKAIPLLTADMQFASAKVAQRKEAVASELLKAAETPQSMVDWANKKGMSVVLHESSDGRTYFINDLNKDGKVSKDEAGSVSSLGSFKTGDWVGEGRKLLVQHHPDIVDFAAKKDIEFEYAKKLQQIKNQAVTARTAANAKDGTTVVGQVQLENGEWAVAYKTKGGTSFTEDEDGNRTPVGEKEIVKTGAKAKDSDEIVEARGLQAGYRATIEKDKGNKVFTGAREKAEASLKASIDTYGDLSQKKGLAKPEAPAGAKGGTIDDKPPVPNAKKAPNGKWYVQKDGKYFEVQ